MPEIELERDADGNIITKPVTGWATVFANGTFVILAMRYAEDERGISDSKQIPLLLTARQCVLLADALRTAAQPLLDSQSRKPSN